MRFLLFLLLLFDFCFLRVLNLPNYLTHPKSPLSHFGTSLYTFSTLIICFIRNQNHTAVFLRMKRNALAPNGSSISTPERIVVGSGTVDTVIESIFTLPIEAPSSPI